MTNEDPNIVEITLSVDTRKVILFYLVNILCDDSMAEGAANLAASYRQLLAANHRRKQQHGVTVTLMQMFVGAEEDEKFKLHDNLIFNLRYMLEEKLAQGEELRERVAKQSVGKAAEINESNETTRQAIKELTSDDWEDGWEDFKSKADEAQAAAKKQVEEDKSRILMP